MPSLRELQCAMRHSIVERDDANTVAHIVANGIPAQERLSVYRNTFTQTLIRALRLSYPAVDRLVGQEFFDASAHEFIVRRPPKSSYLDEFGGDFADFLEGFAPAASVPYLADVARLEWAVCRALHAPDAESLAMARLSSVDATDHAHIRFVPHPSVGLVHTVFPADVIWRAVLDGGDAALSAIDLATGPAWLIIQRGSSGVDVLRLDEAPWRFVDALCSGCPLGLALDDHPGIDAPTILANMLTQGCFASFDLAHHPGSSQPSMRLP